MKLDYKSLIRKTKLFKLLKKNKRILMSSFKHSFIELELYIKKIAIFFYRRKQSNQIVICGFPRSGTSLLYNIISGSTNLKPYFRKNSDAIEYSFISVITKKGNFITKSPSDLFKLTELPKFNVWKKQIIVFICIRDTRDLLVSKHQLLPDKYYMGYNWRLNPANGKRIKNGIIDFYKEIIKSEKFSFHNIKIHFIKYEEFTTNPELITDILEKEGIKVIRNVKNSLKSSNLPYNENTLKAKGTEYKTINYNSKNWIKNKDYIKEIFSQHPDLHDILYHFQYENSKQWINNI